MKTETLLGLRLSPGLTAGAAWVVAHETLSTAKYVSGSADERKNKVSKCFNKCGFGS